MHNTEVMTTIKLSGSLASLFGREHQRLIGPTREAFRALSATIPGFEKFMNTSNTRGMTFAVFVDKKNVTKDDLDFPNGGRTIRIVPVIMGSKRAGVLQTILGADGDGSEVKMHAFTAGYGNPWGKMAMSCL